MGSGLRSVLERRNGEMRGVGVDSAGGATVEVGLEVVVAALGGRR
jgi:hypothetical protein